MFGTYVQLYFPWLASIVFFDWNNLNCFPLSVYYLHKEGDWPLNNLLLYIFIDIRRHYWKSSRDTVLNIKFDSPSTRKEIKGNIMSSIVRSICFAIRSHTLYDDLSRYLIYMITVDSSNQKHNRNIKEIL